VTNEPLSPNGTGRDWPKHRLYLLESVIEIKKELREIRRELSEQKTVTAFERGRMYGLVVFVSAAISGLVAWFFNGRP